MRRTESNSMERVESNARSPMRRTESIKNYPDKNQSNVVKGQSPNPRDKQVSPIGQVHEDKQVSPIHPPLMRQDLPPFQSSKPPTSKDYRLELRNYLIQHLNQNETFVNSKKPIPGYLPDLEALAGEYIGWKR